MPHSQLRKPEINKICNQGIFELQFEFKTMLIYAFWG